MTGFDKTYLSNGCVVSTDSSITMLNANEAIVGATGGGKTLSFIMPKLLHAEHDSYIVPLTKRALADQLTELLKIKEYEIKILDFTENENDENGIGFNPLSYLKTDSDIIEFASSVIYINGKGKHVDPYWYEAAISVLSAEIGYVKMVQKENATLRDVIRFHNNIKFNYRDMGKTNMDEMIADITVNNPDSIVARGWKQLTNNPIKTASNVYTQVGNALDKIFSEKVCQLSEYSRKLNILDTVREKTVLFIITPPTDRKCAQYVNIMYSLFFKVLFDHSQMLPNYMLPINVRFLCDDAVFSAIPHLEKYISIFRACGISISLALQSLAQLTTLYGLNEAQIILDNIDTIIYASTMNWNTNQQVAMCMDIPVNEVANMPIDQFIVCRRGQKPFMDLRYQTLDDPEYKKMMTIWEEKYGLAKE